MSDALADVTAERERQKSVEGWTAEHDDTHGQGEMARAAICYADPLNEDRATPPAKWPWSEEWWKPKDRRRDLVRAGALILAEIERMDRASMMAEVGQTSVIRRLEWAGPTRRPSPSGDFLKTCPACGGYRPGPEWALCLIVDSAIGHRPGCFLAECLASGAD